MGASSRLERRTVAEARDGLRWFLEAIGRGELAADGGTVGRLEGAVAALDALAKAAPAGPGGAIFSGLRREPDAVLRARDGLERVLEAIRRGELTAGSGYVARLEGAVAVLDALLGTTEPFLTRPT